MTLVPYKKGFISHSFNGNLIWWDRLNNTNIRIQGVSRYIGLLSNGYALVGGFHVDLQIWDVERHTLHSQFKLKGIRMGYLFYKMIILLLRAGIMGILKYIISKVKI